MHISDTIPALKHRPGDSEIRFESAQFPTINMCLKSVQRFRAGRCWLCDFVDVFVDVDVFDDLFMFYLFLRICCRCIVDVFVDVYVDFNNCLVYY
jgi:hypothetical protein